MKKRVKKNNSNSKSFKNYFLPLKKRWDFGLIFLFFLGRFILNLELETLSILFAVAYVILISLMFLHKKTFKVGAIMFLFIDSIIGTFIFTLSGNLSYEYFWIVLTNLIAVFLLVFDMKGNFSGK